MGGGATLPFAIFLALASVRQLSCSGQQQGVIQSRWRKVFTADVSITAQRLDVLNARSHFACGAFCARRSSCGAFAFRPSTSTCSLYQEPMEYELTGDPAEGTDYYWPQGQACPTSLSYVLDKGLCFRVSQVKNGWYGARDICRNEGAHLFIADTMEKVALVRDSPNLLGKAWLGASNVTGTWRWVDGTLLPLSYPAWRGGQPSGGNQHWLGMDIYGGFDDVASNVPDYYVCQIPI